MLKMQQVKIIQVLRCMHKPALIKRSMAVVINLILTFSGVGSYFIAFALFFFAFTTILSYYYITETNVAYLTRNQNNQVSSIFINIARVIILFATFYDAVKTADVAWAFGDLGVGLMAWLNIIAIWILHKPAVNALKDYEIQKKRFRQRL